MTTMMEQLVKKNLHGNNSSVETDKFADYTVGVAGYQGYVRVTSKNGVFYQHYKSDGIDHEIKRASIVFHELSENYGRTTLKLPYTNPNGYGAHNYAIDREGNYYGNAYPGSGNFKPTE
jgi:hypothetical protein